MTDRTMPDAHPLESGDPAELGGYEILGRLGEGGQGAVFLGRPRSGAGAARADDHVAIKLLHGRLAGDESARARFVRELEVAKRVARFCTAQVLDADVAGDQPYIVSEYVPGLSLFHVVRTEGPRRGGALERLAVGTLTALTAIHQAGIVHRDFKPRNVMMGPDGPRVIDFGVARALGAAGETQNVGTPAYMAPEHFTGDQVGPAADMFAWGTTMTFAATGRPAFGNDEMASVMQRILTGEPDLGDLPSPMRELVLACLAKDPARRPTAREAQERLLGATSGASSAVPPAMAVPAPPPDHVTDPSGVREGTAPQPRPFADATPPPDGYGQGAVGMPPPGLPGPSDGHEPDGRGRGRLAIPIAAAVAVALVIAGGAAWAATRPSGGRERPVSASDENHGVGGDSGSANGAAGGPQSPTTAKPGQPKPGKSGNPANPSASPKPGSPQRPGGSTPTRGTGGGTSTPPKEPPNKYTPQSACNSGGKGTGYYVLRSMGVSGGVAYLLYSNSTKYNCAVTIKTKHVGTKSPVSTWIQKKGGGAISDSGSFAWYAGPVYVSAPGVCVRFGGNGSTAPYGNCG
ncbi:serine/threonine-protein kinase [Actinomadura sp. NPDC049753]|uniref:serine/threonine protein kinase n=1 Tax=Actinomadura sp. NPDC049753 TaxID=3154739 RepID=UPI00341B75FB